MNSLAVAGGNDPGAAAPIWIPWYTTTVPSQILKQPGAEFSSRQPTSTSRCAIFSPSLGRQDAKAFESSLINSRFDLTYTFNIRTQFVRVNHPPEINPEIVSRPLATSFVSKFPNPATMFRPGQSGNPAGYSRKRRISDAVAELIDADRSRAARACDAHIRDGSRETRRGEGVQGVQTRPWMVQGAPFAPGRRPGSIDAPDDETTETIDPDVAARMLRAANATPVPFNPGLADEPAASSPAEHPADDA